MLRVGGRLQNSEFSEETKYQVILPHGHPVVEKIIQATHAISLHVGPEATLVIFSEKIWLTQGRRDVKGVLSKCLVCRHQVTTPCTQKMAPPLQERAFSVIRVDFAGPLYARTSKGSTNICLFTYALSQMLHLELKNDMSMHEFLQACHGMFNHQGLCNTVWSDNDQTFKAASHEIKQLRFSKDLEEN